MTIKTKMLNYTMRVTNGIRKWNVSVEELVTPNVTVEEHIPMWLEKLNKERRRGAPEILFLGARVVRVPEKLQHEWKCIKPKGEKGLWDLHECSVCGATGKGYGSYSNIVPDKGCTSTCPGYPKLIRTR